jgi:15-cis-phytoene synthase/lycopene beta-cyclase
MLTHDREAIFFLLTNCMIVFGLVAFDNALAVLYTLAPDTITVNELPSPTSLVKALLKSSSRYNDELIYGLRDAAQRLKQKSRSFYVASGTFEGKLRTDLILLYSYCRVADDLVDNAESCEEARAWIGKLKHFLDVSYGGKDDKAIIKDFVTSSFPQKSQYSLLLLPTAYLSKKPLYDMLKGFEMDLDFALASKMSKFPIQSESDLELYSARVAGTVAHLCVDLVFHHTNQQIPTEARRKLISAGENMGIALQLVNISRDVTVDAKLERVYFPLTWLEDVALSPDAVIENPRNAKIDQLRQRLLAKAFGIYSASRGAIEELPAVARGPMRVAVESYMEIGRVLLEGHYATKRGKATVPKWRRILVAWRALNGIASVQCAGKF